MNNNDCLNKIIINSFRGVNTNNSSLLLKNSVADPLQIIRKKIKASYTEIGTLKFSKYCDDGFNLLIPFMSV